MTVRCLSGSVIGIVKGFPRGVDPPLKVRLMQRCLFNERMRDVATIDPISQEYGFPCLRTQEPPHTTREEMHEVYLDIWLAIA